MVQIGMYLRNKKFEIFSLNTYVKKVLCERIHGHIKDTVKFDVSIVRKGSRKFYHDWV
jgi:hypothetical protein